MKNRLSKVLAASGVASRRAAEELIFAGKVSVNGEVVLTPQTMVDSAADKIEVKGKQIGKVEDKVYYILNKPKGYVCSAKSTKEALSVLELFKEEGHRLFTVGRLDIDTEGLLIVTNDGHFANDVIHPSRNINKEYLAKTDLDVTHEHLIALSRGTMVEGTFVKPIRVSKVRKGTIKVTISEGKKREVRMLMEAAGLKVLSLTRIRIGGLHLGHLEPGSYRPLTPADRQLLTAKDEE